jgi:hypothetical protein
MFKKFFGGGRAGLLEPGRRGLAFVGNDVKKLRPTSAWQTLSIISKASLHH